MSSIAKQQCDKYRMRGFAVQTPVDCHADLVRDLTYIEPVQVGMYKLRQSTVVVARAADELTRRVQRSAPVVVFTALHVMQTRYCDENSVCSSVRPSVRLSVCLSVCHTREL